MAVVAALLSDSATTAAARDACAPASGRWSEAARLGLRDPVLVTAAIRVFELACRRLPALGAPPELRRLVEDVTERRVGRGRCPADDVTDPDLEGEL